MAQLSKARKVTALTTYRDHNALERAATKWLKKGASQNSHTTKVQVGVSFDKMKTKVRIHHENEANLRANDPPRNLTTTMPPASKPLTAAQRVNSDRTKAAKAANKHRRAMNTRLLSYPF